MTLYLAGTGEDRKHRLVRESRERRSIREDQAVVFESFEDFLEAVALAEKNDWIKKAVKKPGRCANPGSAECPKGSPQYNLALRFKKGGDLYKKAHD